MPPGQAVLVASRRRRAVWRKENATQPLDDTSGRELVPAGYQEFLGEIKLRIQEAQVRAALGFAGTQAAGLNAFFETGRLTGAG